MEGCLRKRQQPRAEECQEDSNTYRLGRCKRKGHVGGEWGRLQIPNLSKNEGLQTFFPRVRAVIVSLPKCKEKAKKTDRNDTPPNA